MGTYSKTFKQILREEDELQSTGDEWMDTLEKETDPNDFELPYDPETKMIAGNINMVKDWVEKIHKFRTWLNGDDKLSLNAQINRLDRSRSILRGLAKSEENRIIRMAEDLAGLEEVFKAFISQAPKRVRDMMET